jgi:hypothetical protein
VTISLSSLLSSTLSTSTQNQAQLRIAAIQNTLTNRLNTQIAQVEAQSDDTTATNVLQSQLAALTPQSTAYSTANSQNLQNQQLFNTLTTQLATLSSAATTGDSATFDSTLASTQVFVSSLTVVNQPPGLQPDGVLNFKLAGLGIQSSAAYDLSTPAGQAQAVSDVQNAQEAVKQIQETIDQNQQIASSALTALTTQITSINDQLSNFQATQSNQVATQISTLQSTEQTQFHIIELELGSTTNTSSVLSTGASGLATALADQQGSKTASTANPFMAALEGNTTIANQLNGTRLSSASTQPTSATTQNNSVAQAAVGSLLNIFS